MGIFPYIGLIYGRYLQFRFLRWPVTLRQQILMINLIKSIIKASTFGVQFGYCSLLSNPYDQASSWYHARREAQRGSMAGHGLSEDSWDMLAYRKWNIIKMEYMESLKLGSMPFHIILMRHI